MRKSALSLLKDYGDDDEDSENEIPIGRVSTKRSHDNKEDALPIPKRSSANKLPVPSTLIENTENNANVSTDDPLMHDGRVRSFPHERGNWATYIYIPYESPNMAMEEIITIIVHSLPHLELKPINYFHISLTRTVVLKHHWIDSFMQSVRKKVTHIKKFVTVFGSLNVYCNEERTRTFIGVQIQSGFDTLIRLVEQLDSCLNEFRLPEFYKNPSFHMSLVWCVGDYEDEIKKVLPELNLHMEEFLQNHPQNTWYNYVTNLDCKCGNKLFTFNLQ